MNPLCHLKQEYYFEKVVPHLLLNSSFISDPGLFRGKMGLVLFFAHYAYYTSNSLFDEVASNLLADIFDEIHNDSPLNLEDGLCGIGWGVEYLVQHQFMEGDTDEILEALDDRIMQVNLDKVTNTNFRNGLSGIIFYVLARLNTSHNGNSCPFDFFFLEAIQRTINRLDLIHIEEFPVYMIQIAEKVNRKPAYEKKIQLELPPSLLKSTCKWNEDDLWNIPLGIENGLAGIGLQLMKL